MVPASRKASATLTAQPERQKRQRDLVYSHYDREGEGDLAVYLRRFETFLHKNNPADEGVALTPADMRGSPMLRACMTHVESRSDQRQPA
jgi:hypothetical protein